MAIEKPRRLAFGLFQIWEVLVFVAAFAAGGIAMTAAGLISPATYLHPIFLAIFAALVVLWHLTLGALGLYNSRRLVSRANEYLCALGAVTGTAGMLALLGALLGQPTNQGPFLIWFLLTGSALMVTGRGFARFFLRAARARGRNLRFVTVVGASAHAQKLTRELIEDQSTGFRLNAIFDAPEILSTLPKDLGPGRDLSELSEHLMRAPVDEVLIALPMGTHHDQVLRVVEQCRRVGVSARVIWTETVRPGLAPAGVETVGSTWTSLVFAGAPSWGWSGYAKTVMDVTLASLALVVLSPLLLTVALLIKLDSRGPVFFLQDRAGRNKQPFKLFKFRTMVQDAEARQAALEAKNEAGGPVFKMKNDPRITKLGAFLRRYSIDELPQLINVVRGEMSLVGPRPLPFRDVERFEQDWHSRRFSVKPGLTCSWVLAGRSELEFDTWVRLDLDYIDTWSLWKDLRICLHTIPAVFRGSGAY